MAKPTNLQIYKLVYKNANRDFKEKYNFKNDADLKRFASENLEGVTYDNGFINEFLSVLMDKLVTQEFISHVFENPLTAFNRAYSGAGDIKELIATDTIEDGDYVEGANPFDAEKPRVKVQHYKINHKKKWDVAISSANLRTAFLTDGGLNDLVTQSVAQLDASRTVWEYNTMKQDLQQIKNTVEMEGNFSTPAEILSIYKKIQTVAKQMSFSNRIYNNASLNISSRNKKLYLLTSIEHKSDFDTYVNASLFNSSAISNKPYFETIELDINTKVDDKTDVAGYLLEMDAYRFEPRLVRTEQTRNGADLVVTYHFHAWYAAFLNSLANAVKIQVIDAGIGFDKLTAMVPCATPEDYTAPAVYYYNNMQNEFSGARYINLSGADVVPADVKNILLEIKLNGSLLTPDTHYKIRSTAETNPRIWFWLTSAGQAKLASTVNTFECKLYSMALQVELAHNVFTIQNKQQYHVTLS